MPRDFDNGYMDDISFRDTLQGRVQAIGNLLQEKYRSGFPVIKELLQNSDDAKSTKLRFGWTPGLGVGHGNPLLEGPAFIVVNDGPFGPMHADNMLNFSSSMQAGDGATIGSFGLGLKSLFHLGEAILYFSSEAGHPGWADGDDGRKNGALSVWFYKGASKVDRPNWHVTGEAVEPVRAHIASLTHDLERWFCIWVPLRKEVHCDAGALSDLRPGEVTDRPASEVMPDGAPEHLASIMPMLANVRDISFRVRDGRGNWEPRFEVRLPNDAITVKSRGSSTAIEIEFAGTVGIWKWNRESVNSGPDEAGPVYSEMAYFGKEVIPEDSRLRQMADDPGWPRIFELSDSADHANRMVSKPVVINPHAAVYWAVLHGPNDASELRLLDPAIVQDGGILSSSYANYLPLGEPINVPIEAPIRVWNVRHARFWVDSGRLEPLKPRSGPRGGKDFKETWNEIHRVKGIEPFVIPTLSAIVSKIGTLCGSDSTTQNTVTALTMAVSQTEWYAEHREDVCRRWRWISKLVEDPERWDWCHVLRDSALPLVSIPATSDVSHALDVIPELRIIARREADVIPHGVVRLVSSSEPVVWTGDWAKRALDSVNVDEAVQVTSQLRYLNEFIRHIKQNLAPEARLDFMRALCDLVRRLLASDHCAPLLHRAPASGGLALRRKFVVEIVGIVPGDERWAADISGSAAHVVVKAIRHGILVPTKELEEDLKAYGSSLGDPDPDDVMRACLALGASASNSIADGNPEAAILRKLRDHEQRVKVLDSIQYCKFINISIPNDETPVRRVVSWSMLQGLEASGRLVVANDDVPAREQRSLWRLLGPDGDSLEAAVRLALMPDSAVRVFFPAGRRGLDLEKVIEIILGSEKLAAASDRVDGFKWLISRRDNWPKSSDGARVVLSDHDYALRYLLHGESGARREPTPLFVCPNVDKPGAVGWGIAWTVRQGLRQKGLGWQVIGSPLASYIQPVTMCHLNIFYLDVDRAGELLAEVNPGAISFGGFDAVLRDQILVEFAPAIQVAERTIPTYLFELRLHDRVGDEVNTPHLVAPLQEAAFLSSLPCPDGDGVARKVLVVRRSDAAEVSQVQQKLFHGKLFDWRARISTALEKDNPSRYHRQITDAIRHCQDNAAITGSLGGRIRATAWLPVLREWRTDGTCSPNDVLDTQADLDSLWCEIARSALSADVEVRPYTASMLGGDLDLEVIRPYFGKIALPIIKTMAETAVGVAPNFYATGLPGRFFSADPTPQLRDERDEPQLRGVDLARAFQSRADPRLRFSHLLTAVKRTLEAHPTPESALGEGTRPSDEYHLNFLAKCLSSIEAGPSKVGSILTILEQMQADGAPIEPNTFAHVHGAFLKQACLLSGNPRQVMHDVHLRSATNAVVPASELCHSGTHPGVNPAQRAHPDYDLWLQTIFDNVEAVGSVPSGNFVVPPVSINDQSLSHQQVPGVQVGSLLRRYFRPWIEGGVSPPLVGAFVMLLGIDPEVVELAQEWIRPHYVVPNFPEDDSFFRMVSRQWPHTGRERWRGSRRRFTVDVVDANVPQSTLSLAGTPLEVRLVIVEAQLSSDMGCAVIAKRIAYHAAELTLVAPDQSIPSESLTKILKRTCDVIIEQIYSSQELKSGFLNLWRKILDIQKLGIAVDSEMVTAFLPQFLDRIGVDRTGSIGREIAEADNAYVESVQERVLARSRPVALGMPNQSKLEEVARERFDKAAIALRKRIESDPVTQDEVITAMRRFVEQHGYRPSNVLAELFQNADDALGELNATVDTTGGPSSGRGLVRIVWDEDGLSFCHWGRAINRVPPNHVAVHSALDVDGFGRDVTRMLTFGGSRKQQDGSGATGRYGIGFKTVYLVSGSPKVLSGNINFEVRGGVVPVELSDSERDTMLVPLKLAVSDSRPVDQGTHVRLPWRGMRAGGHVVHVPVTDIVSKFKELAEYQLIFSRQVNSMHIGAIDKIQIIRWDSRALPEWLNGSLSADITPDDSSMVAASGRLTVSHEVVSNGDDDTERKFLRIKIGDASLVLGVGKLGFVPTSEHVPTLWVTTVVGSAKGLGFLVDARFELESGRTRLLTGSAINDDYCASIGRAVARVVSAIHRASAEEFSQFTAGLRLEQYVSRPMLWQSLFEVVTARLSQRAMAVRSRGGDEADDDGIAAKLFWGDHGGGLRSVYADGAMTVLPTVLPEPFSDPTNLPSVQWHTDGELEKDVIAGSFLSLPEVQSVLRSGSVIHGTKVFKRLKAIDPTSVGHVRPLRVATLLGLIVSGNVPIIPEFASRLWACVRAIVSSGAPERLEINSVLNGFHFQTADNDATSASADVLWSTSGPDDVITRDEQSYARLRVPCKRLGQAYSGDAVRLFAACRTHKPDLVAEVPEIIASATGDRLALVPAVMEQAYFIPKLSADQASRTKGNTLSLPDHIQREFSQDARVNASLSQPRSEVPNGPPEPIWVGDVQRGLEGMGWVIMRERQAGSRFLDLAVFDPHNTGSLIAAVECDGHTFHSDVTDMLIDQSREVELQSNGVRMIHRVWDVRWNANREFELQRLHRLLLADVARIAQEYGSNS